MNAFLNKSTISIPIELKSLAATSLYKNVIAKLCTAKLLKIGDPYNKHHVPFVFFFMYKPLENRRPLSNRHRSFSSQQTFNEHVQITHLIPV